MASKFNILNLFGLTRAREVNSKLASIKNYYHRAWEASKISRFFNGWQTANVEINREIKSDKKALDARIRDMRQNNPVVAGYFFDHRANVIGPEGFDLQPMALYPNGKLDTFANQVIKQAFDKWSRKEHCTMSKRLSFIMVQNLVADQLVENGEVLLHIIKNLPKRDNPFGISLEILDPQDIDIDYNVELPNGNTVVMGIEFNQWRELVNIYVRKKTFYQEVSGATIGERMPLPADEIIYNFDPLHPKQARGISRLAPILTTLKGMDMWEKYSLDNANFSAGKMGFLIKKSDAIGQYEGAVDSSGEEEDADDLGGKYMDIAGGTIEELPAGYDFKSLTPEFPHAQHEMFTRSLGRKASVGVGGDYSTMFGDRLQESFSAGKTGELKMRKTWAMYQTFFREMILVPLYEIWLKSALLYGALEPLSAANYEKYRSHFWQGVKPQWVDPQKQFNAYEIAKRNGWMSDNQIVSESGNRLIDVYNDIAEAEKLQQEVLGHKIGAPAEKPAPEDEPEDTKKDNSFGYIVKLKQGQ